MLGNTRRVVFRTTKTEKVLNDAMFTLLGSRNFRKIAVRDLCEEALVSRASFYAHFTDKYDLLEYWLIRFIPNSAAVCTYEQTERTVNHFMHKHMVVIQNLLDNMDNETQGVLYKFILSGLKATTLKASNGEMNQKYIVLSNIYAGGLLHYLLWQLDHKFPPEVPPMNTHLFGILERLREWGEE